MNELTRGFHAALASSHAADLASAMGSRTLVRSAQQVQTAQLERAGTVSLVLGNAVQNVIRSRRAILASKGQLAAMRKNRKGIR